MLDINIKKDYNNTMNKRPLGNLSGKIHRYLFNMDEETSKMYFALKKKFPSWSLAETLRKSIRDKYEEEIDKR